MLVALIPDMVLVISLTILLIYLWERRQDGASPQTHEAANDLNQQAVPSPPSLTLAPSRPIPWKQHLPLK
ncbi:MAG TPA: hypothetical protein VGP82_05680 [Ktedonobacterales bacterium]|nr:hypothetical protein [Ktedonobacterales bacterium]